MERKRKREKNTVRVFPPGPREQIKMTESGTTITLSEIKVSLFYFLKIIFSIECKFEVLMSRSLLSQPFK